MKRKIVHTSEIQVISHLLSTSEVEVIVFDPSGALCVDDDNQYTVATRLMDLKGMLLHKGIHKLCVVNISKEKIVFPEIDFVVEFNTDNKYENKSKAEWQYICNPNGTMRWLYPSNITKPLFLSFYNFNYWKAFLYKFVVRLLFFFRMPTLISNGRIAVYSSCPIYVEKLIGHEFSNKTEYSIFTGTHGVNRKIIIAVSENGAISWFFKIALNAQSRKYILNEFASLQKLNNLRNEGLKVPGVLYINESTIKVSNIRPAQSFVQTAFGTSHALFLNHLYEYALDLVHFNELPILGETKKALLRIEKNQNLKSIPFASRLFEKLVLVQNRLAQINPLIPVSICHGDFTSWNCYEDDLRVYVYDWELSKSQMPLFHDLFHYVIQTAVYSKNANAIEIEHLLHDTLENEFVKMIVKDFDIDPALHLQLYLLFNASYYLDIYLNQKVQHKEIESLYKVWSSLLITEVVVEKQISNRELFIEYFFQFMADKKYVLLKNAGKSMKELSYSSDIDLLIDHSEFESIIQWINTNWNIERVKLVKKSFMTTVQLFFGDNGFLSIDLLTAFHRKSFSYIDAGRMLDSAILKNGVKILPPENDYLYIFLFYQINFSDVPEKYATIFRNLNSVLESSVLYDLKKNTGIDSKNISNTFLFSKETRSSIYSFLKKKKDNNIFLRGMRYLNYMVDSIKDFFQNRGVMLTFSGVDGAGKSTILQEVKEMLEKKYRRKVVVIRHRPSMLPILSAWKYGKEEAEKRCVDSLPRKGNNKSKLSSLLRFAYYYADYLFGQIIVYAKYILRGYIVLYDRYYFDFIVDGKRSNIIVNKNFIKGLYRLVYKPELNVFLYAQPEVILKRKKELSADDITSLTVNYKYLFNQLGDRPRYMCIENIDKKTTVDKIEEAFIQLN